jgi:hypothetical protein
MRTAPSIPKEPAPYKSALLAARISMVKWRIATQSLLLCFDEFEDFSIRRRAFCGSCATEACLHSRFHCLASCFILTTPPNKRPA